MHRPRQWRLSRRVTRDISHDSRRDKIKILPFFSRGRARARSSNHSRSYSWRFRDRSIPAGRATFHDPTRATVPIPVSSGAKEKALNNYEENRFAQAKQMLPSPFSRYHLFPAQCRKSRLARSYGALMRPSLGFSSHSRSIIPSRLGGIPRPTPPLLRRCQDLPLSLPFSLRISLFRWLRDSVARNFQPSHLDRHFLTSLRKTWKRFFTSRYMYLVSV